jgi:hypothetical protein
LSSNDVGPVAIKVGGRHPSRGGATGRDASDRRWRDLSDSTVTLVARDTASPLWPRPAAATFRVNPAAIASSGAPNGTAGLFAAEPLDSPVAFTICHHAFRC